MADCLQALTPDLVPNSTYDRQRHDSPFGASRLVETYETQASQPVEGLIELLLFSLPMAIEADGPQKLDRSTPRTSQVADFMRPFRMIMVEFFKMTISATQLMAVLFRGYLPLSVATLNNAQDDGPRLSTNMSLEEQIEFKIARYSEPGPSASTLESFHTHPS
ncbi:hypothetical protein BDP81DRAFT_451290 [Colletotrichum phormii]|uniref:Uncharacterized protein n=1 Tax=Colletotrichum phormii TaxID=359342 RepID=A0AAI9ZMP7_9PEZI|nr:uncharacterized protein BDP81DRAFT_451290 [Colletotrichum phormii]KAK1634789.1 hypothetical protein BDP81DRAFT_451290 [Colletotrichum phormii]